MKFICAFIHFLSTFLLISCIQIEKKGKFFSLQNQAQNIAIIDSAIYKLQEGDLVLRRGKDVTSYMFCQMNRKDKTYSHCGLVLIENGYPFVYHAIGGEENPNQELKRDSAQTWFSVRNNEAIGIARFCLNEEEKKRLKAIVQQFFKERKKFDSHFDIKTNDRFYCAEFVYKSMNQIFGCDTVFTLVRKLGHIYMPVDNLYQNSRSKLIWQVRFK